MKIWLLLIWIVHSDGRVSGNLHEQPFYNLKACADTAAEMRQMLDTNFQYYGYKCVETKMIGRLPPPKVQS